MTDPQYGRSVCTISKRKHLKRRFAIKAFTLDAVDVRKDHIDCLLREGIEGFTFWNNIAQYCVVLFNLWFLAGFIWVAEKERGFFSTRLIIFNGSDVSELAAVIGKDQRKDDAEAQSLSDKS